MTVSAAAIKKVKLWTVTDGEKQAYKQCDQMSRYFTLIPPKELNYEEGVLLNILKYLYGLSESGDAWHKKLKEALTRVMKMIILTGDSAMYIHYKQDTDG